MKTNTPDLSLAGPLRRTSAPALCPRWPRATCFRLVVLPLLLLGLLPSLRSAPLPEECRTFERFRPQFEAALALADLTCPVMGPPDNVAVRNAAIPTASTPFKAIRLRFHIFANNDGSSPAVSVATVNQVMVELNNYYRPWRIQFTHTSRQINNSTYRSLADAEEVAMKNAYAESPASQHNVYIVNIESPYNGWSTFPWELEALTAQGGTVMDDDAFAPGHTTLPHELGHALGLWHTFHGVSEVPGCDGCYEKPGAWNTDSSGDFCSDTPPTPRSWDCGNPGGNDSCSGRPWGTTDYQNLMSYSACRSRFTPQQSGRMHAWIQNTLTGWLVPIIALPEALDTPSWTWTVGGASEWLGQSSISHDGVDAGASGVISHNQESWMQTTVNGPGTMGFWWKVSSEGSYDFLRVQVDGTDAAAISGEVDWQPRTLSIGLGSHTFRWRYNKDLNVNRGQDRGWVDQVTFTPSSIMPVARVVHVDWRSTASSPDGSLARPYRIVAQGYTAAIEPSTVKIRAGSYLTGFLMNKSLLLEPYDGNVLLGGSVGNRFYPSGDEGIEVPPAELSAPTIRPDRTFAFPFRGVAGRHYQVLATTNLVTWEVWKDFVAETDEFDIVDDEMAVTPQRFFKVVEP